MKHARIQKTLSRRCPECGGTLHIVCYTKDVRGVKYSRSFVECVSCGYSKLHRDFSNKKYDLN